MQGFLYGMESRIFKFHLFFLTTFAVRALFCISEGTADDISLLTNFDVTKVLAEIPAHNGHPSLPFRYIFGISDRVPFVCLSILISDQISDLMTV